jgi:P27 family predicted phage terminase small subunit
MPRGPRPTPTKILKDRGSWLANTRPGEIQPELASPDCPTFLSPEAQEEWARRIADLEPLKILSKQDCAVLTIYCEAWAEFRRFTTFLDSLPVEVLAEAAKLVKLKNEAAGRMIKAADHFGFSPAARTRVRAVETKPNATQDKRERFFRAG